VRKGKNFSSKKKTARAVPEGIERAEGQDGVTGDQAKERFSKGQ